MGVHSSYSDAEIAAIGGWLREGFSASQIAGAFAWRFRRHVSRSAIIGLVTRNKALAAIGFAGRPRGGDKAGWQPSTLRRGRVGTDAARSRPTEGAADAALKSPPPSRPAGATPPPAARVADGRQDDSRLPTADSRLPSAPISFLEAMFADRCLFFAGDRMAPAGPDMAVCGAARALAPAGTRWCPHHQSRMTTQQAGEPVRRPALAQWGA